VKLLIPFRSSLLFERLAYLGEHYHQWLSCERETKAILASSLKCGGTSSYSYPTKGQAYKGSAEYPAYERFIEESFAHAAPAAPVKVEESEEVVKVVNKVAVKGSNEGVFVSLSPEHTIVRCGGECLLPHLLSRAMLSGEEDG
jgi:hypothetical protein